MARGKFPVVKEAARETRLTRLHPEIDVILCEGGATQRFCGDNWCTGGCGLPALIIPWPATEWSLDPFSKASGSQVACGAVMQTKRVEWSGARVEVPEDLRAVMEKMWWP